MSKLATNGARTSVGKKNTTIRFELEFELFLIFSDMLGWEGACKVAPLFAWLLLFSISLNLGLRTRAIVLFARKIIETIVLL